MSSISGTGNSKALLYMQNILANQGGRADEESSMQGIMQSKTDSMVRQAKGTYGVGGAASPMGQAALSRALKEMQEVYNGRITFTRIAEYQKDLEEEFSVGLRSELMKQGVPLDVPFTLTLSSEGKIAVACDDQYSQEIIEKYLRNTPKVCEQFGYIQALGNVERARQTTASSDWNFKDVRAEIQASAVEAFFSESLESGMQFSSLFASFGINADKVNFYTGLSYKV